jgi:O-antigen/teichoic acid export membrane protein
MLEKGLTSSIIDRYIKSELIRNIIFTFSNRILVLVIGLITSVLIARSLGPVGRGLYAISAMIIALSVQFGNLGLHSINVHFAAKNKTYLPFLFGNSLFFGLFFGAIISISLYFLIQSKVLNYQFSRFSLVITLLTIPFGILYLLLSNLLLGLNKIKTSNYVELGAKIIFTLLILIAFVVFDITANVTIFSFFLSTVISVIWLVFELLKIDKIKFSIAFFFDHFLYAAKSYFSALFSFLQQKITFYFLSQNASLIEIGNYSVANSLFDMLLILPFTVGTILFPKLSSLHTNSSKIELTKKSVFQLSLVMLVICLFIYFTDSFFIQLLYGDKFSAVSLILNNLLPGAILLAITSLLMNYFASIGNPKIVLCAPLISVLVVIFFSYVYDFHLDGILCARINLLGYFSTLIAIIIYFFDTKFQIFSRVTSLLS